MGEMKQVRRPSSGTILGAVGAVLGLIALLVSISGIAGAAPQTVLVQRGDIAPGAVTAKALANGAVHRKNIAASAVTSVKLADEAVNKRVLKKGVVTARALARDAVTAGAIAPGSVYGGALGQRTIHAVPVADLDQIAANPEWTAGNTEVATCGAGEALLGIGFAMTQPGNREVSWLQVSPFLAPTGDGVSGRYASNSGGASEGQVMALCLK